MGGRKVSEVFIGFELPSFGGFFFPLKTLDDAVVSLLAGSVLILRWEGGL